MKKRIVFGVIMVILTSVVLCDKAKANEVTDSVTITVSVKALESAKLYFAQRDSVEIYKKILADMKDEGVSACETREEYEKSIEKANERDETYRFLIVAVGLLIIFVLVFQRHFENPFGWITVLAIVLFVLVLLRHSEVKEYEVSKDANYECERVTVILNDIFEGNDAKLIEPLLMEIVTD